MLKLSKKMLFALEAVVDIAYNSRTEPVQSKEITRRQGIPQRYLEQVLQQMVHAGILKGVRGPRGGYRLAKERRRLTVGEIVRVVSALEGNGDAKDAQVTSSMGTKVIKPLWDELLDDIMQRLDELTIEDLCDRAVRSGVDQERRKTLDFTI
ncbi:MAG TPA: Rrf2 family transcriptional regulator [Alphaproteobacteria bacterium]|nr:Rrf2 family transcriptional regulator [Alphaproteobacteria bacterium]